MSTDPRIEQAQEVGDCDHPNGTGVDHTPMGDPAKIWRCDSCGHEYRLGDDLAVAWMTKTQADLDAVRAERDELRAELEAQGYWLGDPA